MTPEMNALEERVHRLEQQNCVIKWMAVAVLLLGLAASLKAEQRMRVIEAEKFVLRDSNGRARITIGTPQSSGVAIDTPMDEPAIWISDAKGNDRVTLTTDGLSLVNVRRPAASLTFTEKKGAEIFLYSHDGKLLFHAP
jgi:hypothetical protein